MSVQDFIFRIGADISEFEKSITEVEDELKRWKETLKTATKEGVVQANKNINDLTASIDRLKKAGLDKLPQATNQGAMALNSLGQVARDLPFGFIAIQNNLPVVIDQFQYLVKSSNGVGNAFKAIGASLVGPAGLSFAFGAAIAIVTSLIQKYGSLGNAISVLISKNKTATESQLTYNKAFTEAGANIGSEIAQINILSKTITDSQSSRKEQLAAYRKLKEIAPDVIGNLTTENALTDEGRRLITAQAQVRIELLKLKVRENAINSVLDDLQKKELVANGKLIAAKQNLAAAQKEVNKFKGKTVTDEESAALVAATSISGKYEDQVNAARAELQQIKNAQDQWTNSLEGSLIKIAEIEDGIKTSSEAYKRQQEVIKKSAAENIKNKKAEASELEAIEKAKNESNNRLAKFYADQLEAQAKKNRDTANKVRIQQEKQALIDLQKQQEADIVANPITIPPLNLDKVIDKTNISAAVNLIDSTLFGPLQSGFEQLLSDTDFTFKEFGKIITQAIKRLVAQIIATGIIQLIGTILTGGFGAAAGGATSGFKTVLSGIASSLGFIAPSKIAAPSFSNIGSSGLDMTGAVNLTLRGNDLVAAINRTNTTISRVG